MTISYPKADMFSVQLHEVGRGAGLTVHSVDVFQPDFKHRLTFAPDNDVKKVFIPELAAMLEKTIAAIGPGVNVHSEPDTVVDLPGLTLGRLRIMVVDTDPAARRFVVRFAYFIGGLQAAFKLDTRMALPTVGHREAIAVSALVDICTPALNIIAHRDYLPDRTSPNQTHMEVKLDGIDEVQHELSFYLQLLKRYVAAANPAQTAPEPAVASQSDPNVYEYPRRISAAGRAS